MKIGFFEVQGWEKEYLEEALSGHELLFSAEALTAENVDEFRDFEVVSVFIYSELEAEVMQKMKKLKLVTTRSTGYDHVDLVWAKKNGVKVANVPFYGENTVAEHTFALILALSRNVHKSYVKSLRNDFSLDGLLGFDLKGKTIGVVGAGHIGQHVIRIAKGFGMEVLAYDLKKNTFLAEVLDFEYVSMEDIFKRSDIISLHVPYNKFTHHLVDRERLRDVKKGAILINTARGSVVETEALLEALEDGRLGGAGLDVLEGEKLIMEEKELLYEEKNKKLLEEMVRDHILLKKDNVVFTPHIGFYSREALQRIIETTADNIKAFEKGEGQNLV